MNDFTFIKPDELTPEAEATEAKAEMPNSSIKNYFYSQTNGFRQAAKAMGNAAGLTFCLRKIYNEFFKEEKSRKQQYQPQISEMQKRREILQQTLEQKQTRLQNLKYDFPEKQEIAQHEKQIQQLEQKITQMRTDPLHTAIDENDFNPLKWWAFLGLLIALGLYLWIFYVSVFYSAFFKNVVADSGQMLASGNIALIFNTIFDTMALRNSLHNFNVFVLFSPFIFIALGLLIHVIYEERKFGFLGLVVTLTFSFDTLLAYKIGAQIHAARYLSGLSKNPYYNIKTALTDVNVFAVLFAGFVVYIILSFVFHYFMLEWERSRPVKSLIRQKKAEIDHLKNQIAELEKQHTENLRFREEELEQIAAEIQQLKEGIAKMETMQETQIIDKRELENRLDTFALGWINFVIQNTNGNQNADTKVAEVIEIVNAFKQSLSIANNPMIPEGAPHE